MKKINVGLAVIVAMLGACDRPLEPPEVNDENCKKQAILQWAEKNNLSQEQMWEFSDQCRQHRSKLPEINEENCRPENIKKWGEAKGFGSSMILGSTCRTKGFGEPAKVWGPGSLAPDKQSRE